MKISLIGASGFVGNAILNELLTRDHQILAIARHPELIQQKSANLKTSQIDIFDTTELSQVLLGSDILISAFNAGWSNPNLYLDFLNGANSIQKATKDANVKRYLFVGGAGSLLTAKGGQFVDEADFPAAYKAGASSARDYLEILKEEKELDWTFLSPALEMHQGTSGIRTGHYRTGLDTPVYNSENRSIISVEDLALALVDEVENHQFGKKRFTVGY